jgi:hypothetical protein
MTGQEKDDLLIQVTAWAGLNAFISTYNYQSAPKTTSPMPLSSKNWFGLVKIA